MRGEYVLRGMTADEAKRHGITDVAERKRYVQLAGTKGNEMPPEAFAPIWLRRNAVGLAQVTLDEADVGTVGRKEREALALLVKANEGGETVLRFWRADCVAAGIVNAKTSEDAQQKAMERIVKTLLNAKLIVKGSLKGGYVPA
jgi:hypothetical protein